MANLDKSLKIGLILSDPFVCSINHKSRKKIIHFLQTTTYYINMELREILNTEHENKRLPSRAQLLQIELEHETVYYFVLMLNLQELSFGVISNCSRVIILYLPIIEGISGRDLITKWEHPGSLSFTMVQRYLRVTISYCRSLSHQDAKRVMILLPYTLGHY